MLSIGMTLTLLAAGPNQPLGAPDLARIPSRGACSDGAPEGLIRVESHPVGASVFVDWEWRGRAPMTVPAVSTTRPHVVWVKADGYVGRQETVRLLDGETRLVRVALIPERRWYGLAAVGVTRSLSHLDSPKISDTGFRKALRVEAGYSLGAGAFIFGMFDTGRQAVEAGVNHFDVFWYALGGGLGSWPGAGPRSPGPGAPGWRRAW